MVKYVLSAFADEYDQDFQTQLIALNGYGIKYIEIRGVNGKNVSLLSDEEVENVKNLLDKYGNETIKLALLQTNYRGDINVTDSLFPDAEKHLYDFYKVFKSAIEAGIEIEGEYPEIDEQFNKCMDDDFNTALAISNLYGYFKAIKSKLNASDNACAQVVSQIRKTYSLIGLFKADAKDFIEYYEAKNQKQDIPAEVKAIADERFEARKNKDWAKSDELRDKLASLGYVVKDAKDGYELSKK